MPFNRIRFGLLVLAVTWSSIGEGQNLIKNSDFETYYQLPTDEGQLNKAQRWITLVLSADYLNSTYRGWADHNGDAHSGKGYAGFASYGNTKGASEAISQELTQKPDTIPYVLRYFSKLASGGSFNNSCAGVELYGFTQTPETEQFNKHISDMPGAKRIWSGPVVKNTEWAEHLACVTLPSDILYVALTVEKKPGCMQYVYVDDIELIPFKIDLGGDSTVCVGESITIRSTWPKGTYRWEDGSEDIVRSITKSGTYSLIVEINGCKKSGSVTYTFKEIPAFSLGADTTICEGDSLVLPVPLRFESFRWSNGSVKRDSVVTGAGEIHLTVFDSPCSFTDTILISTQTKPVVNLGPDTTLCPGFNYELKAFQNGGIYVWNNGQNIDRIVVDHPGPYWVIVNLNGCTATDSTTIEEMVWPELELGEDLSWCLGETFILTPKVVDMVSLYTWSNGETGEQVMVDKPGLYWVTSTHPCGTKSDSVNVVPRQCECFVQIPNAFTPQMDGLNETFGTVTLCEFDVYVLSIYNRWGELIFESLDPNNNWDGFYQGLACPGGVYMYQLQYRGRDLSTISKNGTLTLIR